MFEPQVSPQIKTLVINLWHNPDYSVSDIASQAGLPKSQVKRVANHLRLPARIYIKLDGNVKRHDNLAASEEFLRLLHYYHPSHAPNFRI